MSNSFFPHSDRGAGEGSRLTDEKREALQGEELRPLHWAAHLFLLLNHFAPGAQ